MTDNEMKEVLELTLETQSKNNQYETDPEENAHLEEPAAEANIARLEQHIALLGVKVPPSFLQFLRITDGIKDYMQLSSLSLRSVNEIIEPLDADDQWTDFAPLHEFVIASGETGAFISFDHSRVSSTGEMPVVWIDEQGDATEFSDFFDFITEQLKFQKDVLTMNEADRTNLPED